MVLASLNLFHLHLPSTSTKLHVCSYFSFHNPRPVRCVHTYTIPQLHSDCACANVVCPHCLERVPPLPRVPHAFSVHIRTFCSMAASIPHVFHMSLCIHIASAFCPTKLWFVNCGVTTPRNKSCRLQHRLHPIRVPVATRGDG